MVYKPVLNIENMLIVGVLKEVPTKNRVAWVVLKGVNKYKWSVGTQFIK